MAVSTNFRAIVLWPAAATIYGMSDPSEENPPRRECFIPLRKEELAALLCAEAGLSVGERHGLLSLFGLLSAIYHYQFHTRLESLKSLYAAFDPDADTRAAPLDGKTLLAADIREARLEALFEQLDALLARANYLRLDAQEIERAAAASKESGIRLNIDLSAFQRLAVYARGDRVGQRRLKTWRTLYRERIVAAPQYQRLVVLFRLKDGPRRDKSISPDVLHLKIFKNIPKTELDMMLPGAKVKITKIDQGKIWLPTISGVGMTAFKLIGGSALLFTNVWAMTGLIGGAVGYGVKSFFSHQRTKDKYHLALTKSLFYQNLDNNAGVLFRLLDEAEEQECREAMLAYYFLWREAGEGGWSAAELDGRIEAWLRQTPGVEADFEIADALDKLARLGLASRLADDKIQAANLADALVKLHAAWDNCFVESQASLTQYSSSPAS